MSDSRSNRSSVTLGGIQKTRFTPVIPNERKAVASESTASTPAPKLASEHSSRRNIGAGRPKKELSKSNVVETGPVSGPFSLGPATIVNNSTRLKTASITTGSRTAILQAKPIVQGKVDDIYPTSQLTELRHLNASAGAAIHDNSSPGPIFSIQNTLTLVQLPSLLPPVDPAFLAQQLSSVRLNDPTQPVYSHKELEKRAKSAILKEPSIDGKVGKIQVYRSGKVTLSIGDIVYKLENGIQTSYLENIAVISSTKNQIINLGPVVQRLVVCPPIMELLK